MDNEIVKQDFELQIETVCGSITHNLKEYKKFVEDNIGLYKTLEVSEDSYAYAKKKRADLNREAAKAKDDWKSVLAVYNKPLEEAQGLWNEVNSIFREADIVLGGKIHEIEDGLRAEHIKEKRAIMADMFNATNNDELIKFAVDCNWIVREEWGNKTYSNANVKMDVEKAINDILTAFELCTGEFRPQMLAVMKETGDLGKAQLTGAKLAKQKEEYNKLHEAVAQEAVKAPEPPKPAPKPAPQPEKQESPLVEVLSPSEFISNEKSHQKCVGRFEIRALRYQIEWLINTCEQFGIQMKKIEKGDN